MTATVTLFVDDEARRRMATLRARAYVGPTPGVVAVDGEERLVATLPGGGEANARALAAGVLAPGERATAVVGPDSASGEASDNELADPAATAASDDGTGALGYVYQGRDDGGVQRLAAELGDGGDAGADAVAAIDRQFGLDAAVGDAGLRERLAREYGEDHRDPDELHFHAQQLAYATDPDLDLAVAAVRGHPEERVRELVAAADDAGLQQALADEDWAWLASLAADRTTRPPVAYEPDDHGVV